MVGLGFGLDYSSFFLSLHTNGGCDGLRCILLFYLLWMVLDGLVRLGRRNRYAWYLFGRWRYSCIEGG